MRILIQRVTSANVAIDGITTAAIGQGMLIFVGIEADDTDDDILYLCRKATSLRIFDDENGVMNRPITAIDGASMLVVSQFTLMANTSRGNRPSYILAAPPEISKPLYEKFVDTIRTHSGIDVQTGTFGADMQIALVNDGPVTILIDSKAR